MEKDKWIEYQFRTSGLFGHYDMIRANKQRINKQTVLVRDEKMATFTQDQKINLTFLKSRADLFRKDNPDIPMDNLSDNWVELLRNYQDGK